MGAQSSHGDDPAKALFSAESWPCAVKFSPSVASRPAEPVGAENPIPSSCSDLVLVNEPAESVASVNSPDGDHGSRLDRYGTGRGALVEGVMRPMSVVVPEIDQQHLLQVTPADEQ